MFLYVKLLHWKYKVKPFMYKLYFGHLAATAAVYMAPNYITLLLLV